MQDTVDGFTAIGQTDAAIGKEINIASGEEHSIGELAEILINELNPKARIVTDEQRVRPDASEVFRLIGDNSLIKSLTKWKPCYTFKEGLAETVRWFKDPGNLARYKAGVYNL